MNEAPSGSSGEGEPSIACRGVTKEFCTGKVTVRALRGIDLEIYSGQLTLLVGPSGCGKTTLLSCIAGILDQTDGELTVLGQDLLELSGTQKARFRSENIGFVFQQFNLLPSLTAAENASIPLIVAGRRRSDALREAAEVLENLGLHDKRDSLPTQLSGGQQQRVAIARALVTQPKLIVCDEPTSALDAKTGHSIMELLREIAVQPGRSVVVVTHDPRVLEFADRIATMEDGRVLRVEEPGRMTPSEAIGLDLRRGSGQHCAASSEDE